mgnify:FL=1
MLKKTALLILITTLFIVAAGCGKTEVLGSGGGQDASFLLSVTDGFYYNIIHEHRYLLILDGLKTTIVISVLAVLFGTVLGGLICSLSLSPGRGAKRLARAYITFMRGIPVLVLLMLLYYVVFASVAIEPVYVAVLAFGLNFAAYVSEMFRTGIESIDKGQTEAGIANGFTKAQTFLYIIMPQAMKQILPVYKGEVISLVKATSVVGYVAVQDITKASDIIRSRTFDAFFPLIMTALLYFVISWLLVILLESIETFSDPRQRREQGTGSSYVGAKPAFAAAVVVIAMTGLIALAPSPASPVRTGADPGGPIAALADLEGKRIAVITGTTGDFVIREKYRSAQVLDMLYPADAALAVKTKKADAFVFDKSTLHYLVLKNKDDFILLPEPVAAVDIVIPMRQDDKNLHRQINSALTQLKEQGTLASMYQKWFIDQQISMPPISAGKKGTLKVATCLLSEPFAFVSNGEIVGYDMELAYRIAAILDVNLEIADMTYDAMITALATGKTDIAIANYYKIEEREKKTEFSIPYLTNDIAVMVRKEGR